MLEVDQPPTIDFDIPHRHPSRDARRLPIPQKDLIIVHTNGFRAGSIIPQQRSAEIQRVLAPAGEPRHKLDQSGMVTEFLRIPVLVVRLDGEIHKLRGLLAPRPAVFAYRAGADAGVLVGRLGGVEDALDGVGAFFEDAGWGEEGEVLSAGFEDILAGEKVLEEEVAVLFVAAAQFVQGEGGV